MVVDELARINSERASELFRVVAVGYLSLPLTFAALLAAIAFLFTRNTATLTRAGWVQTVHLECA